MKPQHGFLHTVLLEQNRGLLLDIVVFFLNLFLMQRLTGYALEVFRLANEDDQLAQFVLLTGCIAMWILPAAGAVLKRWHFHERLKDSEHKVDLDAHATGCLFNPIFYFCLNLVLMSAIVTGVGRFVW